MAQDYENLELDRIGTDGRVGRITLNRPEKMNALSQELLFELNDALHEYEADDSVRVIVLKGAGRTFSAGYDLAPPRGGADAVVRRHKAVDDQGRRLMMGIRTGMQQITDIQMYYWNMAKVTIAQVHGYCLAGGCELAMMSDLVCAADDVLRTTWACAASAWPATVSSGRSSSACARPRRCTTRATTSPARRRKRSA
ncbi:MAG: enoyl-CoA hydratase/isomerase family protein [Dehalococcoidia bacterium]|nr:enoyl-CoA hydratase/isomerase family protein [Dehalococcoidia bacterium]